MAKGNGISKDTIHNSRVVMNTGYIIIPSNVDRDSFVENCFRREKVSILVEEGGGVVNDCYITKQALKDIDFPTKSISEKLNGKSEEKDSFLGSAVNFISEPYHGQPIILGTTSKVDESGLLTEGLFRQFKLKDGNFVSIQGDAKSATISIDVSGGDNDGSLNINVRNKNENSKLNINVRGDFNTFVKGNDNKKIQGNKNETIKGNKISEVVGDINLKPEGLFKIGEGSEPILLGDKTVTELNKAQSYVDLLQQATQTALVALDALIPGTSAAFIATMQIGTKPNYDPTKSDKAFTD